MKKMIGAISVGLLVLLTIGFVSAYQGDPLVAGPAMDSERHAEMQEIFETKDYDAWLAIMNEKPRITDIITEENFDQFVAMHEARANGDIETAKEIAEELGLPQRGPRDGFGKGLMQSKGMRGGNKLGQGQGNCTYVE
jgi:hypothetical protein